MAGISYRLAMKFAIDKSQILKVEAQEAFQLAAMTDQTPLTISINPNFSNYML